MNVEQYDCYASVDFLEYEFYSRGPKGVIKKLVIYTPFISSNTLYFNLGFGDWNSYERKIDDFIHTNNGDTEKVLATVAFTVVQFFKHYPQAFIYVEGSTLSRTRLYQMKINKVWKEIEIWFNLYGLVEGEGFSPYERNTNYLAFLISKKNK